VAASSVGQGLVDSRRVRLPLLRSLTRLGDGLPVNVLADDADRLVKSLLIIHATKH
jgi:hypothetical protein